MRTGKERWPYPSGLQFVAGKRDRTGAKLCGVWTAITQGSCCFSQLRCGKVAGKAPRSLLQHQHERGFGRSAEARLLKVEHLDFRVQFKRGRIRALPDQQVRLGKRLLRARILEREDLRSAPCRASAMECLPRTAFIERRGKRHVTPL